MEKIRDADILPTIAEQEYNHSKVCIKIKSVEQLKEWSVFKVQLWIIMSKINNKKTTNKIYPHNKAKSPFPRNLDLSKILREKRICGNFDNLYILNNFWFDETIQFLLLEIWSLAIILLSKQAIQILLIYLQSISLNFGQQRSAKWK